MEFDVLISNGTVVDGTGNAAFQADVGITDGRVAAIGPLADASAERVIDASGLIVSPGFIDVHVHSEVQLADPLNTSRYQSVFQGVTTHLAAPDGFGWAPLDADDVPSLWESTLFSHGNASLNADWSSPEGYLQIFEGNTPVNVVPQVPHCAVRYRVMGWDARPATDDELDQMRHLTRQWLDVGAVALCLGLDYQPSAFSDTRELIELSKVAREYGAIYAAHVRYNDLGRADAWREAMVIGEQADIPVHISHEHVTPETGPLLREAGERCDLTFESYLYPAGCTHLALTLPIWAQAGGPAGIRQRLREPTARARIREHLAKRLNPQVSGDRPVFVDTSTGRFIGQTIYEAADSFGLDAPNFALQVLEEEDPYALMVYHRNHSEEFVEASIRDTIQHPAMIVASDGLYHGVSGHPRGSGTFARVLRLCVREMKAVSLESAVRKMSGYPAERFGIKERGVLKVGNCADIAIFNADTIADRSTWQEPFLEPVGIASVLVNGVVVAEDGVATGTLPGKVVS